MQRRSRKDRRNSRIRRFGAERPSFVQILKHFYPQRVVHAAAYARAANYDPPPERKPRKIWVVKR